MEEHLWITFRRWKCSGNLGILLPIAIIHIFMKNKPIVWVLLFAAVIVIAGIALFWYGLAPGAPNVSEIASDEKMQEMSPVDTIKQETKYLVATEEVEYTDGVVGTYAAPTEPGDYPGVVMIHEWWGLNDNIRQMAEELAGQGYHVLAVDLYHGEVADAPERARELVGSLEQPEAVENLQAAVAYLRERNASKVASLGWCFGGGQSMQLALNQEDLDATVIYYGNLVTDPTALHTIDWPVLGIFGEEDTSIPVETVREFEQTLDSLGIAHEVYVYPGVGHAFANPSGANYAPEETADAWDKTLRFLADALE